MRQRQRRGRDAGRVLRLEPGVGLLRPVQEPAGPVQPDRLRRRRRTVLVALLPGDRRLQQQTVHADLATVGRPTAAVQAAGQHVVVVPLRDGQEQPAAMQGRRAAEEDRPERGGQTVQGVDGQEVGQHVRHGQVG